MRHLTYTHSFSDRLAVMSNKCVPQEMPPEDASPEVIGAAPVLPSPSAEGFADFLASRYDWWDRLRDQGPLVRILMPSGKSAWVATTYAFCHEVLGRGNEFLSRPPNLRVGTGDGERGLDCWRHFQTNVFLYLDGEANKEVRTPLLQGFKPDGVAKLRPVVTSIVKQVLDEASTRGEFDFVDMVARPISARTTLALLGCDSEDWRTVAGWAEVIGSANAAVVSPATWRAIPRALNESRVFIEGLLNEGRGAERSPALTALIGLEKARRIDREKLISNVQLLLAGGHATTRSLLGNAMYLLLSNPNQYERLRENPKLSSGVAKDTLWVYPVTHTVRRFTAKEVDLAEVRLPPHSEIICAIASAQRDPARNVQPGEFILGQREDWGLAFGHGQKRCIGALLADLECALLFEEIAARPRLKMVEGFNPSMLSDVTHHGYQSLMVANA